MEMLVNEKQNAFHSQETNAKKKQNVTDFQWFWLCVLSGPVRLFLILAIPLTAKIFRLKIN